MATMADTHPTLLDLAKRVDPDNSIAAIVELLNQTNEMLLDMVWMEGNLPTGHRTTVRSGLPTATWRKLYQRVQPSKSTTVQVDESTGMLEDYAEIDKALADLNGNTSKFRLSESKGHLESMSQEIQQKLLYGDLTEPESFVGFTPRFNDGTAQNAANIIDGGSAVGQTDNRSIWLIGWSEDTISGLIPKGSQAGWQMNDKGQVTSEQAGGLMEVYRTHFRWDAGLLVKDWRYAVRIANIDFSELTPDASTGPNLPNLMFEALDTIESLSGVRPAFYMSKKMRTFVRQQAAATVKQSTLTVENIGGVMTQSFHGVPIRRVDKLNVDEARIDNL